MDINSVLQKGYISRQANNTNQISILSGPLSPTELWLVPIHKFEQHWDEMMMDKTLFPSHNMVSYFLRPPRSPNQLRASFFSVLSLLRKRPAFLSAATHQDHLDQYTWLKIYQEEKQGLLYHLIYTVIIQEEYHCL